MCRPHSLSLHFRATCATQDHTAVRTCSPALLRARVRKNIGGGVERQISR